MPWMFYAKIISENVYLTDIWLIIIPSKHDNDRIGDFVLH